MHEKEVETVAFSVDNKGTQANMLVVHYKTPLVKFEKLWVPKYFYCRDIGEVSSSKKNAFTSANNKSENTFINYMSSSWCWMNVYATYYTIYIHSYT